MARSLLSLPKQALQGAIIRIMGPLGQGRAHKVRPDADNPDDGRIGDHPLHPSGAESEIDAAGVEDEGNEGDGAEDGER